MPCCAKSFLIDYRFVFRVVVRFVGMILVGTGPLARAAMEDAPRESLATIAIRMPTQQAIAWIESVVRHSLPYSQDFDVRKCAIKGKGGEILGHLNPSCARASVTVVASLVPGSITLSPGIVGVRASVDVAVSAGGNVGAGHGLIRIPVGSHAALRLWADIGLTVDTSWHTLTTLSLRHEWVGRPTLDVCGLPVADITKFAEGLVNRLQVRGIEQAKRDLPQKLDVPRHAQQLWDVLSTPRPVASDIVLHVNPSALGLGAVAIDEDGVSIPFVIRFAARVHGAQAQREPAKSLPPPSALPIDRQSLIGVDANVPIERIAAALDEKGALQLVDWKENVPPVSVTVGGWSLRGDRDRIVIGAVARAATADIEFEGLVAYGVKPGWDAANTTLFADAVDVDSSTEFRLRPLAALLAEQAQEKLRFNVGNVTASLSEALQSGIRFPLPSAAFARHSALVFSADAVNWGLTGLRVDKSASHVSLTATARLSGRIDIDISEPAANDAKLSTAPGQL